MMYHRYFDRPGPRMNSREVPHHWAEGKPAKSYGGGNLHTDGETLYSYGLTIGETIDGKKVLYDYSAGAGRFVSMTTSHHVGQARGAADVIMEWNYETQEWDVWRTRTQIASPEQEALEVSTG